MRRFADRNAAERVPDGGQRGAPLSDFHAMHADSFNKAISSKDVRAFSLRNRYSFAQICFELSIRFSRSSALATPPDIASGIQPSGIAAALLYSASVWPHNLPRHCHRLFGAVEGASRLRSASIPSLPSSIFNTACLSSIKSPSSEPSSSPIGSPSDGGSFAIFLCRILRVLEKKMQREGVYREMKRRRFYEKLSEKAERERAEAIRRAHQLARKQA
jgi:ribosomal protein S21